jgi:hypothetical protein
MMMMIATTKASLFWMMSSSQRQHHGSSSICYESYAKAQLLRLIHHGDFCSQEDALA